MTALAVVLRAIGLGGGLWFDEIVALFRAYREPLSTQFTVFQGDFHHTFYSVLASLGVSTLGESEWAIRLPALIFGAATIPLAFLLGREVAGPRDGWLAAGLLTALFRWEPGSELPFHEHVEIEQTYVLKGTLIDDEGVATAGNYVWRPAGSRHIAKAPDGALVLAFFLKPNKFLDPD